MADLAIEIALKPFRIKVLERGWDRELHRVYIVPSKPPVGKG